MNKLSVPFCLPFEVFQKANQKVFQKVLFPIRSYSITLCKDDTSLLVGVCRFGYKHAHTGLVAGEFCRALLGLFPGVIVVADETPDVLFLVVK